jgi:hypothetical protein
MEHADNTIDISDTPVGNIGAMCVAAVMTLSDSLTDVKMRNCGIGDSGALNLFEELAQATTPLVVDLTGNPITS